MYFVIFDKNMLICKIFWVFCLMKFRVFFLCGEMEKLNMMGLLLDDGYIVNTEEFI